MISKKKLKEKTRYNPFEFEKKIYNFWIPYFKPKTQAEKNFIILTAPPNITGALHLGHAFENIILDTIARFKRMQGYNVVWLPGVDHAGIATQNVVERELKKQGISRFDLGREKFLEKAWKWREKHGNIILEQFKKLGLSLDWSRTKFTLDKEYVKYVEEAFVDYYKKGLVYRALRPVNFCSHCQTSLSDLELEEKEQEGRLYYIKYPLNSDFSQFITIATTRPETILGDVALAVNPKDNKNFDLVGKQAVVPIINRKLLVITDQRVDPKFGTGILKITPAHSLVDYEISLRHGLNMISVIDENAKMNENAGEFRGLDYLIAREKIVEKLKALALLEKIEKIIHRVPVCERCHNEIQVIPSKEWFLKMNFLAKLAISAVKNKEVQIFPLKFKKLYFHWLYDIYDWCVSRKLWWGQQMPVWYCQSCGDEEFVISLKKPKVKCKKCKKSVWRRTEEVFDTWFSSALWPFAILYTKKEKKWYPADLVSSARDILHLWITRMIFSSKYFMKKTPFKIAFIHPTILTKEGKRMSKSLGIGIDPLELIEKYGSDALRFGLLWQMTTQQDVRFDFVPIEQGFKFLTKIWNAYRFYFLKKEEIKSKNSNYLSLSDKKILKSLNSTKKFVERKIEKFELGLALKKIYKFFWYDVCNHYLESCKKDTKNNPKVFDQVMFESLKLLHLFLPHLTQLIYFTLGQSKPLFFEKWN